LARYWWPNPDRPGGLPFIRKDGHTNPQVTLYPDETYLENTIDTVSTLSHAYALLGNRRDAARATLLITHFFLDPSTGMLPDFSWAQFIPGRSSIEGDGILDGRGVIRLLDDVTMLRTSRAWTHSDDSNMDHWLDQLLNWLLTSSSGRAAAQSQNNHGTWYDDEVLAISLFLGKTTSAESAISDYVDNRLPVQVQLNGEQPLELARTKSWSYSTFNLDAALNLAVNARYLGVNVYQCRGSTGTSISDALHYLIPFAVQSRPWPHPQKSNLDLSQAAYPLDLAAVAFGDRTAQSALRDVPEGRASRNDGIKPLDLASIGHTQ
jgi:hypothetical protein